MAGKEWDRDSEEFKLIREVFKEKFPEFQEYDGNPEVYEAEEYAFQGFLAAWEFIREHTTELKELVA